MKPITFMLIAGEPSGDLLAAELVRALKQSPEMQAVPFPPSFFGAGGSQMASVGVELVFDLTQHSVIGISEVLKKYWEFKRLFDRLVHLAFERRPDVIICVDFQAFNRRFIHAIRKHVHARCGAFNNWNPKIVQYVSPQVWASRPGRAYQLAEDVDLLLSVIPFEKEWYAGRVPKLRVDFVGHPIVERYAMVETRCCTSDESTPGEVGEIQQRPFQNFGGTSYTSPQSFNAGEKSGTRVTRPSDHEGLKQTQERVSTVLLLPGSRVGELQRHLPVMVDATRMIQSKQPEVRAKIVLPNHALVSQAKSIGVPNNLEIEVGGLPEALQQATMAIASTGTVTLECACFGVPTVAIYKTSWSNYFIAKQIVTVKYLAMPNLLADESIYPELIQGAATGENVAREALDLLNNVERRRVVKTKLAQIVKSLGESGASQRAAQAVLSLLHSA